MDVWIAFAAFMVLTVWAWITAAKLRRGRERKWDFAANPVLPDGRRRYHEQKRRRALIWTLRFLALVFLLTAAVIVMTQILEILPDGFLTAALYLHGACIVFAGIAYMMYLDNDCQTFPETDEEESGGTKSV